jgi:hypothetical protein
MSYKAINTYGFMKKYNIILLVMDGNKGNPQNLSHKIQFAWFFLLACFVFEALLSSFDHHSIKFGPLLLHRNSQLRELRKWSCDRRQDCPH